MYFWSVNHWKTCHRYCSFLFHIDYSGSGFSLDPAGEGSLRPLSRVHMHFSSANHHREFPGTLGKMSRVRDPSQPHHGAPSSRG